ITNLHTTFNVAFAIVNKEDEEAYTWLVERLENLRVTETVDQQICLWHVLKNVQSEVKRKWNWPDGQQPPQQALREQEEEDNHMAWQHLIDQFAEHQEPAVSYILSTYFPWRKHFLECFTRQNRNFGVRVTSRTEGSHKELKSYLLNSRAELRFLASRVEQLVKDQEASYNAKRGEEATRQLGQYSSCRWMGDLRYRLSRKALGLVAQQHRICHSRVKSDLGQTASQRRSEPPPECTGAFRHQFGLPCSHDIERKLRSNQELSYLDTHPHWHLEESLAANDPLVAIEEP
ncbi:hypothetical protein N658DRAFT_508831, partial [Parathielavia hyrcaniae]